MANSSKIEAYLRESSRVKAALTSQSKSIEALIDKLVAVSKAGGTIYSCGNGGSACDAMHLTEELVARYLRTRPGIKAAHLCDPGVLTCWSNDCGFESAFERQVETLITKNDALIAFSTSGNSKNILRAISKANEIGALTVGLLGKNGGEAKQLVKLPLVVESDITSHIQEAHIAIVHIICDCLEVALFPNAK